MLRPRPRLQVLRPILRPALLRRNESTAPPLTVQPDQVVYHGPLANTFKRLKVFSLSSLSLCATMSPLMFAIETSLPLSARAILATTALTTSGISTGLISWAGHTYVTELRARKHPETNRLQEVEATTLTLRLKPRITKIYDPTFVVRSSRPFAKWELAELVLLPPNLRNSATVPGQEETVAETRDDKGTVLGRWVVRWGENGEGSCHEVGKVMRYFNVHDELLPAMVSEEVAAESKVAPGA
ncbi:hypothetical protein MKEN_00769800 [Mycena kentingensis (nom. inval.)]|nr:hypothetical protein MKEN_00769800 [Mycena kentingensis (nom. inval.)]